MITAIIVAAGKGTRMGPNVDKLFLEVAGLPVVGHTWRRLDRLHSISEIVLVVREGMESAFHELGTQLRITKPLHVVPGGKERQDSVWNGLQAVSPGCELVAIQDAARPCTRAEVVLSTITAAQQVGAAVAAQAITDTIKESSDGKLIERTVDRSRLWSVQTPQTFRLEVIRRAMTHIRENRLQVTDDTAACELIGQPVQLVVSNHPNPKVTRPEDLPYVEMLLKQDAAK